MSFSVGQPEQSGLDLILQGLGTGVGTGLQQSLADFHQKQQSKKELKGILPLLKDAGVELSPEDEKYFIESGLPVDKLIPFAGAVGRQKEAREIKEKASREKELKLQEDKKRLASTFSRLVDLTKSPNIGIRTNPKQFLGSKAVEEQSEFTSLKAELVGSLRELVNRGALTNQKFNYIVNTLLPQHNDRQASIRGKLKGIAKILGVEPEEIGIDISSIPEKNETKKKISLEEIFR